MSESTSLPSNTKYLQGNLGQYIINLQDDVLNIDTSSGAITLILPNIVQNGMDLFPKNFYINDTGNNAGTNNITLQTMPGNSMNLSGSTTFVLKANGVSAVVQIVSKTEWLVSADQATGGPGTVTNFAANNFSPLFTTSVANSSTTPTLSFAAINQTQNLVYASPNGGAGAPSFRALVAADLPSGSVIGTGTQNFVTKWNNAAGTTIGNSLIFDNGTNAGIGTTNPGSKWQVIGNSNTLNGTTVINPVGASIISNYSTWNELKATDTTVNHFLAASVNVNTVGSLGSASASTFIGNIGNAYWDNYGAHNLDTGSVFPSLIGNDDSVIVNASTGSVQWTASSLTILYNLTAGATIANAVGYYANGFQNGQTNSGTTTNYYGFYNRSQTGASGIPGTSNRWNVYAADPSQSYFNGLTGFGSGNVNPASTVDILGTLKYVDGNQAAGKVLQTDASGNATWQTNTGGISGLTTNYFTIAASATTISNSGFRQSTSQIIYNANSNAIDYADSSSGVTINTNNHGLTTDFFTSTSSVIAKQIIQTGTNGFANGQIIFNNATNAFLTSFEVGIMGSTIQYILPVTAPTAGQVLSATAPSPKSTLSWVTASAGSVTSVSVVTNQGVSGSVATATTTPAITLTLGALTGVTSINGLAITANTGAVVTGSWTATKIGLAYGGTNADLSGTGGTSNYLKQSTVGGNITVGTISAGDITSGAALTKADDTNVTLTLGGTPASALLVAASITAGWTGTLAVGRGGTGLGSYAVGDILYASGATTLASLADVATGSVLVSGGVTTSPAYSSSPTITTSVTTPIHIGGTAAGSSAEIRATSGTGTTEFIKFTGGTNGGTEYARFIHGGALVLGTTTQDGSETFSMYNNTNGQAYAAFRNPNAGANAYIQTSWISDTDQFAIRQYSSGNANFLGANAMVLTGNSSSLNFNCSNASGFITFGTSAFTAAAERMRILAGGAVLVGATTQFGSELFSVQKSQNGVTQSVIYNATAGTGAYASQAIWADTDVLESRMYSSAFTTSGLFKANTAVIISNGVALAIINNNASGALQFATGGNASANLRLTISSAGLATWSAAYQVLAAGTATAGTAPLKFTSGTALTSPEAGAMEFTTDNPTFTITTGSARKNFVLDNGTLFTANYIPYATTNGRLTSSTMLQFDGTNFVFNQGAGNGGGLGTAGSLSYLGDYVSNDNGTAIWVNDPSNYIQTRAESVRMGNATGLAVNSGTVSDAAYSIDAQTGDVGIKAGALRYHQGTAGDFAGDAVLVSGTKAITISGLSSTDRAVVSVTVDGGTIGVRILAVCTANTLTLTSITAAGATQTLDTSTIFYAIIRKY